MRTSTVAGVDIQRKVWVGSPVAALLSAADAHAVDLIILSRHGRTGASRWELGSVVERVARYATTPVLVLPESVGVVSPTVEKSDRPWHELVPLDGSAAAEAALAPASCLVGALGAPEAAVLHLLLVITLPLSLDEKERPALLDEGMQACLRQETACYLRAVQQRFLQNPQADHRGSLTSSLRFGEDVAETVLTVSEQEGKGFRSQGVDLITMTTCGHGGQSWMMGHVASRVLSATRLPLLLVSPPQPEQREITPGGVIQEGIPLPL